MRAPSGRVRGHLRAPTVRAWTPESLLQGHPHRHLLGPPNGIGRRRRSRMLLARYAEELADQRPHGSRALHVAPAGPVRGLLSLQGKPRLRRLELAHQRMLAHPAASRDSAAQAQDGLLVLALALERDPGGEALLRRAFAVDRARDVDSSRFVIWARTHYDGRGRNIASRARRSLPAGLRTSSAKRPRLERISDAG